MDEISGGGIELGPVSAKPAGGSAGGKGYRDAHTITAPSREAGCGNQRSQRQPSSQIARQYLCRGIRQKRFRKPSKWHVANRFLYGLMLVDDIKVSDLAEILGVNPRTVQAWVYEGVIPKEETMDRLCDLFGTTEAVLFN